MVSAGRVVCIFTPFVLSLAALGCMVVMFLAGTKERNATLGDLYFVKFDLSNMSIEDSTGHLIHDSSENPVKVLAGALQAAKKEKGMKDYYTIYLSNYCAWNNGDEYAYCSPRENKFWFDPIKVWGLDTTSASDNNATDLIPVNFHDGLETYRKLSISMFYLYAAGTAAAIATILVGISAIFSRWGSFVTTFFASAASLFILVASALATSIFGVLKGVLVKALDEPYNTKTTFGNRVFALTWIGTAFAVGAWLFWVLSICCCSGRSPYNPGSSSARKTRAEKTPYTYERVGSPLPGGNRTSYQGPNNSQALPLKNLAYSMPGFGGSQKPAKDAGTAYEPFRSHA